MPTLNVDSALFQRTQAVAAAQGKTAEQFAEEALRKALDVTILQQTVRNGLPVMVVNGSIPAIDPSAVRRSLEEDGF
jgi:hypothetical protein